MILAPLPDNEALRQQAVEKYQLLDTMPEERYDNITAIVAGICDAPIAVVALLDKDRNFLKSRYGVNLSESPRAISFCGHAILEDDIMVVPDARQDKRFKGNPLVSGMQAVFYAGAQLIDKNGYKLGTLCVYDHKPRALTASQTTALKAMAKQVMYLFEEHYLNIQLQKSQIKLKQSNQELQDFAGVVSHDLKAPLSNINMIATLLAEDETVSKSIKAKEYLGYLNNSSLTMGSYIDGMLTFYRSEELTAIDFTHISFVDLMEDVITMCKVDEHTQINYKPDLDVSLYSSDLALQQILLNLVTNAIKYNDKEKCIIEVSFNENKTHYTITVQDNGIGIAPEQQETVFKLFQTAAEADKFGNRGTGIGLATVGRLIEQLHGTIALTSQPGVGSTFTVSLPKTNIVDA